MKSFLCFFMTLLLWHTLSAQSIQTVDQAKAALSKMQYGKALQLLQSDTATGVITGQEAIYLEGEINLMLGKDLFLKNLQQLDSLGADTHADILRAKYALFIGVDSADEIISRLLQKYPENSELPYCQWLLALKQGRYSYCKSSAADVSENLIFPFAPYLALYNVAWDNNFDDAISYLDSIEMQVGSFYESKYRKLIKLQQNIQVESSSDELLELPYAQCGPGMGILLTDSRGDTIKMELDTGTGYSWMTIHDSASGSNLPGKDTLTIKNGISYNYMNHPRDFHFKLTDFKKPFYENLLVGYFNGRFSKADGCFSPFFFPHHAIQFDPLNEKVYFRTASNLAKYKKQYQGRITSVPYVIRNGWIFIPCKVNQKTVLMMVETGSRDVNFNRLAATYLDLPVYDGFVRWRGKDYPTKKVDCTIEIGEELIYEVKGGLVNDFVLGNHYYGLASAGDLGPDFFKNYVFTIDPFNREIIFEQPKH